jgi:hypothetical protein
MLDGKNVAGGVTESLDPDAMRAEYAALDERVVALKRQFDAARANGDSAVMRRLQPLIEEASEHLSDARWMPDLREAATGVHYREGEGWQGLDRCSEALDHLLYLKGSDGVGRLEVVEASPTRVTLVGRMYWVIPCDCGDLIEATFTFDQESQALTGIVVRAGEDISDDLHERGDWDDLSARQQAKRIANRPESDEQWDVVIRSPSP